MSATATAFKVAIELSIKNLLQAGVDQATAQLKGLGTTGETAGHKVAQGAKAGSSELKKLGQSASEAKGRISELHSQVQGLNLALGAGLASAMAVGTLAMKKGLGVLSEYSQGVTELEVKLGGDRRLANLVTSELAKRSAVNPFELPEMVSLAGKLLGVGIPLSEVMNKSGRDLLTVLGDAKAVNRDVTLDQMARNYYQVTQGSFQLPEMMAIGVGRGDFEKKGIKFDKNGSFESSGQEAADAFVEILIERYKGGMDKLSRELPGLMSTFNDSVKAILRDALAPVETETKTFLTEINKELGELGKDQEFMGVLRTGAKELAELLKTGGREIIDFLKDTVAYLKENPTALTKALHMMAQGGKILLGVLTALIGLQGLLGLLNGIMIVEKALPVLLSLFSGPAGWVVGIGLVVAALIGGGGLVVSLDKSGKASDKFGDKWGDTISAIAASTETGLKSIKSEWQELIEYLEGVAERANKLWSWLTGNSIGESVRGRADIETGKMLYLQGYRLGKDGQVTQGGAFSASDLISRGVYINGELVGGSPYNDPKAMANLARAVGQQRSQERRQAEFDKQLAASNKHGSEGLMSYLDSVKADALGFSEQKAQAAAADEEARKAAEKAAEQRDDAWIQIATSAAASWSGSLTNACVYAAAKRLRALGFDVPASVSTTEELIAYFQSNPDLFEKISKSAAGKGDLLFTKDKNKNGMPDHVFLALADAVAGQISGIDQDNKAQTYGLKRLDADAYRIKDPVLAAMLGDYMPGGSTDSGRYSWLRQKIKGVNPWDDSSTESQQRVHDELIKKRRDEYEWLQKLDDGLKSFLDSLRQRVEELTGLRDGLLGLRTGLQVSLQRAMGFDRGADVIQAEALRDRALRAKADFDRLGPGAKDEDIARGLQKRGETVQAMLDMAASLRERKGAEQLVSGLLRDAQELMKGLPEEMLTVAQTLDEKLSDATQRWSTTADRWAEVAELMRQAAYGLMDAAQRQQAERLAVQTGRNPGAPITGGALPGYSPSGGFSKYAPAAPAASAGGATAGQQKRMPSDWSAPGWSSIMCYGDGTCLFEYDGGGGGGSYGPGGAYPEDGSKDKQSGAKGRSPLVMATGLIDAVTALLDSAKQGVEAQVQAIGGLVGQFNPELGGFIGSIGGLIGAAKRLFGGDRKQKVEVTNDYLNVRFPQSNTYGLEANPAAAPLGGRALTSGPAHPGGMRHVHEFTGEFKNVIRTIVSEELDRGALAYGY